jgi:hypothetical protein
VRPLSRTAGARVRGGLAHPAGANAIWYGTNSVSTAEMLVVVADASGRGLA